MAITIISQPVSSSLYAAYRPIVIEVTSSVSTPVVYCDIYISGTFYKSQVKTLSTNQFGSFKAWQFDIQDACQEVLKKMIADNGGSAIVQDPGNMAVVYCKFRDSTVDGNGFTIPEGPAPVQATGRLPALPGTGTQSNSFYVVNAVLQHENNQDLAAHLNSFKLGTWGSNTFPFTHRQDGYRVNLGGSDYFPILHIGSKKVKCIQLNYRNKGQHSFKKKTYCTTLPCEAIVTNVSVTNSGNVYTATWTNSGAPAASFALEYSLNDGISWSAVTNIVINNDHSITYQIGISSATSHQLRVTPICSMFNYGVSAIGAFSTIVCIGVEIPSDQTLPAGKVGTPYQAILNFTGTAPVILNTSSLVFPAWVRNVYISGSTVVIEGLPDVANTFECFFSLSNCSSSTAYYSRTIEITGRNSFTELSNTTSGNIRTQVGQIGSSVTVNDQYYVVVYSHQVTVSAIAGDTPSSIATKLAADVNATTASQWNEFGVAPATGTPGFKPTATASGSQVTLTLNIGNQFAMGVI